jgi:hypothetical protein
VGLVRKDSWRCVWSIGLLLHEITDHVCQYVSDIIRFHARPSHSVQPLRIGDTNGTPWRNDNNSLSWERREHRQSQDKLDQTQEVVIDSFPKCSTTKKMRNRTSARALRNSEEYPPMLSHHSTIPLNPVQWERIRIFPHSQF